LPPVVSCAVSSGVPALDGAQYSIYLSLPHLGLVTLVVHPCRSGSVSRLESWIGWSSCPRHALHIQSPEAPDAHAPWAGGMCRGGRLPPQADLLLCPESDALPFPLRSDSHPRAHSRRV